MQDTVIKVENLSKVYHLYNSPLQMLLHKLGMGFLLRKKPGEHAALNNVSLQIKKGEKVAFIGRNGAGKSTILKLISGVSEPTSGSLKINGEVHALLSIGSGFHQDFTGRENVYAYLANQGISGKRADELLEEIVEFSEVEEYIDQPLRTYSTGMGVRLMFATSTIIAPEVLILDEVLGVGDAYFAQKSYDRMRDMATGHGTTLLLVTHDIYSAVNLCERIIWIDKGGVLMDGPAKDVVAAYENSVKMQEEERLRVKNMRKAEQRVQETTPAHAGSIAAGEEVLVEIKPGNGMYFEAPFYLAELELRSGESVIARWSAEDKNAEDALIYEGSQWGVAKEIDGSKVWEVKDYGNPFQKVALRIKSLKAASPENIVINLLCYSDKELSFTVNTYFEKKSANFISSPVQNLPSEWRSNILQLSLTGPILEQQQNVYGTTDIVLRNLRCFQDGEKTLLIEWGKAWKAVLGYEIKNPDLFGKFELVVVIQKDGITTVNRSALRKFEITGQTPREGNLFFGLPHFPLTPGEYSLSVSAVAESYCSSFGLQQLYTIDKNVYCSLVHALKFQVHNGPAFVNGTVVALDMEHGFVSPVQRKVFENETVSIF